MKGTEWKIESDKRRQGEEATRGLRGASVERPCFPKKPIKFQIIFTKMVPTGRRWTELAGQIVNKVLRRGFQSTNPRGRKKMK